MDLFNSVLTSLGLVAELLAAVLTALRAGTVGGGGMLLRAFFKGSCTGCSTFIVGLTLGLAVGIVNCVSCFTAGRGAGLSVGEAASMDGSEWLDEARLGPTYLNYWLCTYVICVAHVYIYMEQTQRKHTHAVSPSPPVSTKNAKAAAAVIVAPTVATLTRKMKLLANPGEWTDL